MLILNLYVNKYELMFFPIPIDFNRFSYYVLYFTFNEIKKEYIFSISLDIKKMYILSIFFCRLTFDMFIYII